MLTDKIGDLITRIRNGFNAGHQHVFVRDRKFTRAILTLLEKEGYLAGFEVAENYSLKVNLKYVDHRPSLRVIERVSKPGCRKYIAVKDFKPYYNGLGVNVLSTSKGIMSDFEAKKANIGGELLFRVF